MNSKSDTLFRLLVGLIIISAILHVMSSRLGYYYEFPFVPFSLFALNAIVLTVYGIIAFQLGKVRKSYHRQSYFSPVEIRRFKQIGVLLLFLIPINGLIEVLRDFYTGNPSPGKVFLNFLSYSFFKSPSFLFAALIIFILIEYLPVAEKNRADLGEII
ncbi:hypothetical protein [Jiulongibacter sediminis]|uniref:Uncharacterized protein n=1 Tax=Jiulongibacter sediminis TaxID=1605367 RepID=A0A0P7BVI8_9BACT|nr:hypothetical protein [Jiulongibacter sediminis]KPM48682.1 hypothetical protein AFM12_08790 [Jiulongibacter sediminis]TBX25217.1 hypothetical protein TK44_08795 [Jiulongibacter sediminis]